jgi:hypothetical protein
MFARLPRILTIVVLLNVIVAQPAAVTLKVEPYFYGHFKFGEWLPLHVTLTNDGPPVRAEVRADATQSGGHTTYSVPVELPTGARKRLTLYVQPPSFAQAIRVRLMDGDRELASQTAILTVERNANYLIGLIAPRLEAFAVLGGLTLNPSAQNIAPSQRPVIRIPMSVSDIPDRVEGLRPLDAIVLSDVDTSELTPDQAQALQAWVEQGGRLILGGGASAARTLGGLPEALVKDWRSTTGSSEVASLEALGQFGGNDVRVSGPFVVTWPAAGYTLISQDEHTLLAEKRLGEGFVNYAALDLSGSPFDAWAGASRFWEKLLTPGSAYPVGAPTDVSPRVMRSNSIYYALQNLPALELPAIRPLAGLLIVYIFLIGPINYLALRRLRKLEWGWLSIFGLTLVFSAGAFALGSSLRGGDVILNEISVLNFDTQSAAPVQSYLGIFSPERNAYTLNVAGRALVAPIAAEGDPFGPWGAGGAANYAAVDIVQGEPTQVRGVQVNQGAMQAFRIETPLPDDWRIESDLTLDGDRVRGTLLNRTSESIVDAVIVYNNRYMKVADLPPGQAQTIDQLWYPAPGAPFPYFLLENALSTAGPAGPSREFQTRQQILQSQYQSFSGSPQPPPYPTLIGWMRASPLDVQVDGVPSASQQTSLVIATLKMQYPPGPIHLPLGAVPARLVSTQGDVGTCGQSNQVFVNNGSAVLEFQLPEQLASMHITRLVLSVQGVGSTVELADRSGDWVKLDSPQYGDNVLTDPERFVSGDGLVRVQISSSTGLGCLPLDIEVEGELNRPD